MGHDGKIIAELTAMYVRGELTSNEYEHAKLLVEKDYGEVVLPPEPIRAERIQPIPEKKKSFWYYAVMACVVFIVSGWVVEFYQEATKSPAQKAAELAQRQAKAREEAARAEKEKQRVMAAKVEAEQAKRDKQLKEREAREAQEAKEKVAGLHCMRWSDSSNPTLIQAVKSQLRDPESFQHVLTSIDPVDAFGEHAITMKYRARNGFGGMNVDYVSGKVRNADCAITEIKSQED